MPPNQYHGPVGIVGKVSIHANASPAGSHAIEIARLDAADFHRVDQYIAYSANERRPHVVVLSLSSRGNLSDELRVVLIQSIHCYPPVKKS